MKNFFNRLWCWFCDHPYPKEFVGGIEAYQDWLDGNEPFPPNVKCSHCGAVMNGSRRGMHS